MKRFHLYDPYGPMDQLPNYEASQLSHLLSHLLADLPRLSGLLDAGTCEAPT